jgi:tripartite-type tricarboxylate transporter receptor subunit TctC
MKRLLFFFLLALALPAAAQYPNRTVTMLTGYPAGGLVDIVARMVAENMKPRFPGGLVVVNRAGAVAVGELTRAAPDGYTFILTPHSALVIAALTSTIAGARRCAPTSGASTS